MEESVSLQNATAPLTEKLELVVRASERPGQPQPSGHGSYANRATPSRVPQKKKYQKVGTRSSASSAAIVRSLNDSALEQKGEDDAKQQISDEKKEEVKEKPLLNSGCHLHRESSVGDFIVTYQKPDCTFKNILKWALAGASGVMYVSGWKKLSLLFGLGSIMLSDPVSRLISGYRDKELRSALPVSAQTQLTFTEVVSNISWRRREPMQTITSWAFTNMARFLSASSDSQRVCSSWIVSTGYHDCEGTRVDNRMAHMRSSKHV